MRNLDRLLRESLTRAGAGFQARDVGAALDRFRSRRRRRNLVQAVGVVAMGATAVYLLVALGQGGFSRDAAPELGPVNPAPITPSPTESAGVIPVRPEEVLFVYSAAGDIRAQMTDGEVVRLTTGRDNDFHPAIAPDGKAVLFERANEKEGRGPILVYRDLATGQEREIGTGSWPAFAPDGRVAWVRPAGAERNEIVISRLFAEPELILRPLPDYSDVRHIRWAPDSSAVYYEAGQSVVQHFVDDAAQPYPMTPADVSDAGDSVAFSAPTMRREDRVEILRLCCRDDRGGPFTIEIGAIRFTEGGPVYQSVTAIDPRFLSPAASEYFAAYAGPLTVEGDHASSTWSLDGEQASWIVSDGDSLYLVDDAGGAAFISDLPGHESEMGSYAGVAVSPYVTSGKGRPRADD